MSIQRTKYDIQIARSSDGTQGQVLLIVDFNGEYVDVSDALLMIADAWCDAMKDQGFEPIKSITSMEVNGHLQ